METPVGLLSHHYLRYHLQNRTYIGLEYCEEFEEPQTYFKVPWNNYSNENENKMYIVSLEKIF